MTYPDSLKKSRNLHPPRFGFQPVRFPTPPFQREVLIVGSGNRGVEIAEEGDPGVSCDLGWCLDVDV